MEAKLKHLEFIQATINRMAGNSFLLKGWAITLVGALFTLTFKEVDRNYLWISLFIIVIFWGLDGYYLSREKLFRELFKRVGVTKTNETDFTMDTKPFEKEVRSSDCIFSKPLVMLYGGLALAHIIILLIVC